VDSTQAMNRKAIRWTCAAWSLVFSVMVSSALACSWPPPKGTEAEQTQAAYDGAEYVFVAKLRSRSLAMPSSPSESIHENAQLVVLEVFKGDLLVGQPVSIRTNLQDSCGVSLINGPAWIQENDFPQRPSRAMYFSDTWLLYVTGREPFAVAIYSRSRPVNLVRGDIDVLRQMPRRLPRTWKSIIYR
jgi:hypothetical protein